MYNRILIIHLIIYTLSSTSHLFKEYWVDPLSNILNLSCADKKNTYFQEKTILKIIRQSFR